MSKPNSTNKYYIDNYAYIRNQRRDYYKENRLWLKECSRYTYCVRKGIPCSKPVKPPPPVVQKIITNPPNSIDSFIMYFDL